MNMVTYGDYFSRKTLHYCGVSPDRKLFDKEETSYTGMQRMDKIRSGMSEIYQTLYRGYTEQNAVQANMQFDDFQIERKIVAAFYDSGVLNNAEREYFQTQPFQGLDEREQICVEEAKGATAEVRAQKVDAQAKIALSRDMRQ